MFVKVWIYCPISAMLRPDGETLNTFLIKVWLIRRNQEVKLLNTGEWISGQKKERKEEELEIPTWDVRKWMARDAVRKGGFPRKWSTSESMFWVGDYSGLFLESWERSGNSHDDTKCRIIIIVHFHWREEVYRGLFAIIWFIVGCWMHIW